MLLEIAIGDAYGAAFEYAAPTSDRPNDLSGYFQHPRHGIAPGCYTDDTQMSLAVAETLLEQGVAATALQFIEKFVLAFKRDPREGYAGRFSEFLKSVRDAEDFAARISPESAKSGAAMRSCPIGVLPRIADILALASARHAPPMIPMAGSAPRRRWRSPRTISCTALVAKPTCRHFWKPTLPANGQVRTAARSGPTAWQPFALQSRP